MNSLIEHIDYYKDGDKVVFTALFHLKRGYCCGNGCLNCSYIPKYIKGNKNMDINKIKEYQVRLEQLEKEIIDSKSEDKTKEVIQIWEEISKSIDDITNNIENELNSSQI